MAALTCVEMTMHTPANKKERRLSIDKLPQGQAWSTLWQSQLENNQ
jgi:hypothetical protein